MAEEVEKKIGRPRAITPQVEKKILSALRLGMAKSSIAKLVGINLDTLYSEAARNKIFAEKLDRAVEEGKLDLIKTIKRASKQEVKGDAKLACWLLERRHFSEFAKNLGGNYNEADFLDFALQLSSICQIYISPDNMAQFAEKVKNLMNDIKVRISKKSQY